MDLLLDVQLQLSRVAAGITRHGPPLSSAPAPPTASVTPVLIHIEQLLDEIRAATRAIVAKASQPPRSTDTLAAKPLANEDFRVKLESDDVVDYESETETEDEATAGPEKTNGETFHGVGVKRSREGEGEEKEEPLLKRANICDSQDAAPKAVAQMSAVVKNYSLSATKCVTLDAQTSQKAICRALSN
ncbi:hypothetical protein PHYPSEUDO_013999 [Phytophthora pseudosyringae]|uniref:Uncharacterized protein n=1 Tax=Phytophthora pseudosyringae TaxID=221518 RepID=A0A8T1V819_9STRA|nr:hypothetical protein PHYPSEUDO_013999 [Phytophthora pseudosyringae]